MEGVIPRNAEGIGKNIRSEGSIKWGWNKSPQQHRSRSIATKASKESNLLSMITIIPYTLALTLHFLLLDTSQSKVPNIQGKINSLLNGKTCDETHRYAECKKGYKRARGLDNGSVVETMEAEDGETTDKVAEEAIGFEHGAFERQHVSSQTTGVSTAKLLTRAEAWALVPGNWESWLCAIRHLCWKR